MSTTSAVLPWLGICLKKKITRKQEKRKETGKTDLAVVKATPIAMIRLLPDAYAEISIVNKKGSTL